MTETYARTLVTVQMASVDVEKDWLSHTVYHHHSDEAGTLGPFDPAGHAVNVNNAFQHGQTSTNLFQVYSGMKITTRVYNMSDAKPRPMLAEHVYTPTGWTTAVFGPRELAVCLRYYGPRNLVGQRGRLYIGAVLNSWAYPNVDSTHAHQILDLGLALGSIGGAQMSWVLASTKGPPVGTTGFAFHDITNIWVNDQFQHMESREQAEVTRWTATVTPGLP